MKRYATDWENFCTHVSHKGTVSRMYGDLLQYRMKEATQLVKKRSE